MGTEEGMGKTPASSVGSDDVLQVESKWPYLLRCEPWYQGTRAPQSWALAQGIFLFYCYFFGGSSFFSRIGRLTFSMSHFQVSQDLDESFSSLSRLGDLDEVWTVKVIVRRSLYSRSLRGLGMPPTGLVEEGDTR